jgi:hypothetical protein
MCDGCKEIMPDFGIPHAFEDCPYLNSLYCSHCARKARHTLANCPDKPSRRFTQPCFVEQLVPPSLLKEYGITTRTPLPPPRDPSPPKRLIEILDDDEVITQFLLARSVKRRKGESLRGALQRFAAVDQRRVIYMPKSRYVPPPEDIADFIAQIEEDTEKTDAPKALNAAEAQAVRSEAPKRNRPRVPTPPPNDGR